MLYNIARNILGDESSAEDAVHDTFIGYYKMSKINVEIKFTLITILKNACYSRWRLEKRYTGLGFDVSDETGEGYDDTYNYSMIKSIVEAGIQNLGEEQKKVFELRYYANMSYRSICVILNKEYQVVINTYNQCIENIKSYVNNAHLQKTLKSKYRVVPSKYVPREAKERKNEAVILDTKTGERVTLKVAALLSGMSIQGMYNRLKRKAKKETRFKRLN
jgi:RNA polymerase sigma-70 factor (ECF subfamily)